MHSKSQSFTIILRGQLRLMAKDGSYFSSVRTSRDFKISPEQAGGIKSIDDAPKDVRAQFATIESATLKVVTTETTELDWK